MPSDADVRLMRELSNNAVALARRQLEVFLGGLDLRDVQAAQAAIVEFMPALVDQYGSVAAGAAADWYEELREASTARGGFRARVEPVNLERVNGAARWAVYGGSSQEWFMTGELIVSLDAAKLASRLTGLTDRLVKQAARDTVASNVSRDRGATYSRVPTGAHTCAFCLMLASRGPVYGSKESAGGDGNKYHHECDCVPTPSWGGNDLPKGYDPDALYEVYRRGVESAESDSMKSVLASIRQLTGSS